MYKTLKTLLLLLVALVGMFGVFSRALAAPEVANGEIGIWSVGGTEVSGYVNSTNTGFTIKANLTETTFDHANIYLNSVAVATISETGWLEYGLTGITNAQLQTYLPSGINTADLEICTTAVDCSIADTENILADYDSPVLSWSFSTTSGKKNLAIGDSCTFLIDSTEDIALLNASYNGQVLSMSSTGTPGNYELNYIVSETDASQETPLQFDNWSFVDTAGNLVTLDSSGLIDFGIDTEKPVVNLYSPLDKKLYNIKNIEFLYSADESVNIVSATLDGAPITISYGDALLSLNEGDHSLVLVISDLAGNTVSLTSNFKIDSVAPFISYNISQNMLTKGGKLVISGSGEIGSTVLLKLGGYTYSTAINSDGSWLLEIDSAQIDVGTYELSLIITYLAGNVTTENLGQFVVNAVTTQSTSSSTESNTSGQSTVAQASSSGAIASDVRPKIVSPQENSASSQQTFAPAEGDVEEPLMDSQINSGTNDENTGFNWSAILVALTIIALISAAIAAGYYGYEFIILSTSTSHPARKMKNESNSEGSQGAGAESNISTESNKPNKTRW